MRLDRWVGAPHLQAGAIGAYRARMDADRFRSIILDDFLLPERLAGLRALFAGDGRFEDFHGRKQYTAPERLLAGDKPFHETRVADAGAWSEVVEADRLAHEEMLAGPRPGCEPSLGWVTHLRFKMLMQSQTFIDFLEAAMRPATLSAARVSSRKAW
jgi:hypothetical protein